MKAAYINQPGPPENIIVGELPTPEPTGSQVLVRVAAAALNPIDTYIRSGTIKMDIPLPFVVGCDLAGVVEKVGPAGKAIQTWAIACGAPIKDCSAGRARLPSTRPSMRIGSTRRPTGVSDETAAACALVGITAHLGLVRDAKLKAGETLFVNGGTGGVGSMVVQMAKALGARVITTAGSDEKVAPVPRARGRRGDQLQDRRCRRPA